MLYFTIALLSFVLGIITHKYLVGKVSEQVSAALADIKESVNRVEAYIAPPVVTPPETPPQS